MWELVIELFLRDAAYYSWQSRPESQTVVPWFSSADENLAWHADHQDYVRWQMAEPRPVDRQTLVIRFDDQQSCLHELEQVNSRFVGASRLSDQPPGWDADWSINYAHCQQPFGGPMWTYAVNLIYGSPPNRGYYRMTMWAFASQQECEDAWTEWRRNLPASLALLAENGVAPEVSSGEQESWDSVVCSSDGESESCGPSPICRERRGVPSGFYLIGGE